MKRILFLLLCSASLFAMPAKRTPTLISQPDGTTFSLVGFGDERYNFAETMDGYVVVRGADKFWYYAELNPEGKFSPGSIRVRSGSTLAQNQALMSIPKHLRESQQVITERLHEYNAEQGITAGTLAKRMPVVSRGQATVKHVLILCVQYSDIPATQTSVSFQSMVNDDSWRGGIGGMSKYYEDVSHNTMSVEADYKDWVTAAQPSSYYANNNPSAGTHEREMISAAVDAAEAGGVDFSQYDNDGDGEVDGLFIVHAGPGAEEGSQNQYIWSHQTTLGGSYARTYDGTAINAYIIMPELYSSQHVEIGVFCHEYGHMLGLPDLYDVNGSTNGASEGVGNWCLMASGSWGGDGGSPERPAQMSAYCKELLGFTVPEVVTSSQALTIPQAETNAFAYKIWMDGSKADEYMLIENRQKTGFDANLPGSGLLIYHVDKNLADIWPASNKINVTNTHLGVKVYEADGSEQMAGGMNRGNNGDPYPGFFNNTSLTGSTTPNSKLWNTSSSGVEITGISASSATMTATATVVPSTGSAMQFYRKLEGYSWGSPGVSSGYGMVMCTPAQNGKLLGVRAFSYANSFTTVTAAAFAAFNGSALSSPVGSAVSSASATVDNFVQLNFSPAIDVTAGVPVYVRVFYQKPSGGWAVPIDFTDPPTGYSYHSDDGSTFTSLPYDIAVRVVFQNSEILPVQLTQFAANTSNHGVTLRWETASEVNNFGFEVEKGKAGEHPAFVAVPGSFIPGQGTTLVPHTYSFIDSSATPGKWMYRLKQIDLDGSIRMSDPIEVDLTTTGVDKDREIPTAYALSQNYPNPFNPTTTVTFALPEDVQVRISVYDLLGREVSLLVNERISAGVHTATFDASGLPSGAYFYRMEAGSFIRTMRLMIVK
jgi:M6 family metalloprotease-like protein